MKEDIIARSAIGSKTTKAPVNEQIFNPNNYPKVLLLGNGINRCYNKESWDGVLNTIRESFETQDVEIEGIPFPLQAIILTKNRLQQGAKIVGKMMMDSDLSIKQRELLEQMLELNFDAILTTNYSYELEKTLQPSWNPKTHKYLDHSSTITRAEGKYALQTFYGMPRTTGVHKIWHIHGEARKPSSIVLGHEYYGNLIGKYSEYIKRKEHYHKGIPDNEMTLDSWIDYYLLGEVHILGFGFDYSEIDLWWLQSKKASIGRAQGDTFYYDLSPQSTLVQQDFKVSAKNTFHHLLSVLNVEVIPCDAESFESAYRIQIEAIRANLKI